VKSFTFGGINSRDFDIFISGEATYNSPERDVEMIDIPGRNGAIVQDNGKFHNISVTYPAFIRAGFESRFEDFKAAISQFTSYQRLVDEYHPDFYREGIFTGPMEPRTGPYNKSGKFNVEFNCKPQRFSVEGAKKLTYYPVNYADGETNVFEISGIEVTPGTVFQLRGTYNPGSTLSGDARVTFYNSVGGSFRVDSISTADNTISYSATIPATAVTVTVRFPGGMSAIGATGLMVVNDGMKTWYSDYGPMFKNPFLYTARPIITIYGGMGKTLTMSQVNPFYSISIAIGDYSATDYDHITIDSVAGDSYFEGYVGLVYTVANMNQYVTLTQDGDMSDDYPEIVPGNGTVITTAAVGETSTIEKIEIVPGWWTV